MDERLRDLAKGSPNFGLLYAHQPLLSIYGALAEATVFTNPNASLVQAGQFGEVLAEELVTRIGMRIEGDRQVDRLTALTRTGVLVSGIRNDFDQLRRDRNTAAHRHPAVRLSSDTAGSIAARTTATTASSPNDCHGYRWTNDNQPGHRCCSEAALVTKSIISVTAATAAATSAAMVTRRNFTISTVRHIDKKHYEE